MEGVRQAGDDALPLAGAVLPAHEKAPPVSQRGRDLACHELIEDPQPAGNPRDHRRHYPHRARPPQEVAMNRVEIDGRLWVSASRIDRLHKVGSSDQIVHRSGCT